MERELDDGWAEGIHPDDVRDCMAVYRIGFDRREPFERMYAYRRHDGEYRWILDRGPRGSPPTASLSATSGRALT